MTASGVTSPGAKGRALFAVVTAVFFASGSAGLVYQVLWMRSLGLFFGSDMYGVSIVLSTFMAGLAFGSLLGGWLSERTLRPIFWYGAAELGIGGVALVLPALLAGFDPLLQTAYAAKAGGASWIYQAARILFAVGVLLVPTTFMGATFPLIMRHFARTSSNLGSSAAHFYAVNTLGALAGTLAAGFVLLPFLGMSRATAVTAAINGAIGLVCVVAGRRALLPGLPSRTATEVPSGRDPIQGLQSGVRGRVATAALVAIGVSGFGSFALEVAWTRVLLISFSATVYSFATTLACFLLGIFLGSRIISSVVDDHEDPLRLFAQLELGIGASVASLAVVLHFVPDVFGRLLMTIAALLPNPDYALVLATIAASFPLLVVPATLLGATFPVALRIYTTNIDRVGSRTGNIYASNTFGAVLGALFGGLVLLPAVGAIGSIALIALLYASVGLALAWVGASGPRPLRPLHVGFAALATVSIVALTLAQPYRLTLNFNQRSLDGAELLYHSEGVQNTIDVVRAASGATSLVISGNVEADDSYRQRRHFVLKGHLPLMLADDPETVLVVGLGMGVTLKATARHPGLERIDVIELSPGILDAQPYLASVNGDVLDDSIVHVRIDDGRLFMKVTDEHFDMITADPIHPKISRVGYLYTREYYQSIRERLNEGGVVCQWMPIYQIAPRRLRSAFKSFVEVFPHATLWYVEGHALLVSRLDSAKIDYGRLAERFDAPAVREDLASIDIHSPPQLLSHLLMGPDAIRAFIDADPDVPLNTDDYPYLEYFVPGDLFHSTLENVNALVPHISDPAEQVTGIPSGAARELATESERRRLSIQAHEEPGDRS